jgi:hypothetical protein
VRNLATFIRDASWLIFAGYLHGRCRIDGSIVAAAFNVSTLRPSDLTLENRALCSRQHFGNALSVWQLQAVDTPGPQRTKFGTIPSGGVHRLSPNGIPA